MIDFAIGPTRLKFANLDTIEHFCDFPKIHCSKRDFDKKCRQKSKAKTALIDDVIYIYIYIYIFVAGLHYSHFVINNKVSDKIQNQ